MKSDTPLTEDRIDRVCKTIEARKITLTQFAKEIGMGDKYSHVFKLIRERSHTPNAEIGFRIEDWLSTHEKTNGKVSAGKPSRKNQPAKKEKSK